MNIITTKLIADSRKADGSKTESIYINDVPVGRLTAYYDILGRLECYNADLRCAGDQWGALRIIAVTTLSTGRLLAQSRSAFTSRGIHNGAPHG